MILSDALIYRMAASNTARKHCQESLLNCIKNASEVRFLINFDSKTSTRIFHFCIK